MVVTAKRETSLDVLRAIAVIGMMLSGRIPFGVLPAWMYHAQEPPPNHVYNPELPGLTWVDLVFPWFLFAMGAAIPLALNRQLESGPVWKVLGRSLVRLVSLIALALVVAQTRPGSFAEHPLPTHQFLSLLAFVLMIPALARLPSEWPSWALPVARVIGWGGLALMLFRVPQADGSTFTKERNDIIILLLGWASLGGTLIWTVCRRSVPGLVAALGLLVAYRFSTMVPGSWQNTSFLYAPYPWLFAPEYLQYVIAIVPGLLAGTIMLEVSDDEVAAPAWVDFLVLAFGIALVPVSLDAFLTRNCPNLTMGGVFIVLACLAWFAPLARTDRRLLLLGLCAFAVGILLEPAQGGIKKDPPTLSYLIGIPGLGCIVLASLRALARRRFLSWVEMPLAIMGANALLAYCAINHLISPLWSLTIGEKVAEVTQTPELGVVRAVVQTVLLIAAVVGLSKAKVQFRA